MGCVPSLSFDLRTNYGGGNEDSGDFLQKVPCTHCCFQCPLPRSRHHQPTPPPETPRHSRASLGQFIVGLLLLSFESWCTQGFVCALQVLRKFWWLYGGLMATSKEVYGIPRSAALRAPVLAAGHCWPVPPQEILRHCFGSISVGSLGPGAHKVCLSPPSVSGWYGIWF